MAGKATFKYSRRRGAASFLSGAKFEPSLNPRHHLTEEMPADSSAAELRKDVDASRDCEGEKDALLCEGSDRPITEKDSTPRLKDDEADSGDVILEYEEDDSDDEPAVLSLPDMSPAESLLLEEELCLDQLKDRRSQGKTTEAEVWQTEEHKNHMAAISSDKFDNLLKMSPDFYGCKSHMATFVLTREVLDTAGRPCERYNVVALGAGRSSCSKWLCFNGTVVHDCHAIVIARRALLRFLYKQLLLFFVADPEAKENCIFESTAESHQLQLKPKISLHLYTNQCPEGSAKNFYFKGSANDTWTAIKLQYHVKDLLVPVAYLDPSLWAARVCCMSGSDKLCRWTVTGIQGKQKVFNEEVSNITNKRLGDGWHNLLPLPFKKQNIVFLPGDYVGPAVTSPGCDNLSINWCLGDKDIEVLDCSNGLIIDCSPSVSGPGFSSRLCKRALYGYFLQVAQLGGHSYLLDLPTYHSVKVEASGYQAVKERIREQFMNVHAGPWNSKKLVDCFST